MENISELLGGERVEASAPCRIDMGGTLDLSTFYLPLHRWGPCTFNIALDMRTHIRISAFQRNKIKISSRGFDPLVVDAARGPFDHPLGLMLAVAAYFNGDGIQIEIDSSSPPRSALGGSSAAAAALIWAFSKIRARDNQPMPRRSSVALLAHAIEQSAAGVPCGLQDQLAAVYGGVNGWYWNGDPAQAPFRRLQVADEAACPDLSNHLLVAYCGAPHASKDVNSTWVRQFVSGRTRDPWLQILQYSRQFIDAMVRGDLSEAQMIMNRETQLRCRLTPEVLDAVGKTLVDAAAKRGCGARFTGAGGGGCVWALGDPDRLTGLRSQWASLLAVRKTAAILDARIDVRGLL